MKKSHSLRPSRLLAGLAFLLFAAQTLAAQASDHPVQLVRKEKAGDKHRIRTTVHLEHNLEVLPEKKGAESTNVGSESTRFDFEAVSETLAVNGQGLATKKSYRVETLTATSEGETREILGKGTVVLAHLEKEKTVFEIGGGKAVGDVSAALEALGLDIDTKGADDRIFGTPARQRIGSSWPMHKAAFLKDSGDGLTIDPAELQGTTTLAGERTVDGIPCLELKLEVKAGNVTFPGEGDESPSKGTLRLTATGLFPIDPTLQPLSGTREMERLVTLLNPEGNKLNLRFTIHEETSMTPLK